MSYTLQCLVLKVESYSLGSRKLNQYHIFASFTNRSCKTISTKRIFFGGYSPDCFFNNWADVSALVISILSLSTAIAIIVYVEPNMDNWTCKVCGAIVGDSKSWQKSHLYFHICVENMKKTVLFSKKTPNSLGHDYLL